MEKSRSSFQGITNILRFNWHFYAMAAASIFLLLILRDFFFSTYSEFAIIFCLILLVLIASSLLVSYYIYDISELYSFHWLSEFAIKPNHLIVNIHAGFDETSGIIKSIFTNASMVVLDFYDPIKHTEISIKRARKAYPAYPGTLSVSSTNLPIKSETIDRVFVILAAHEIRSESERIIFFEEINRILKPEGEIILIEHLRDWSNFMAYTIGVFHFYSLKTWYRCINTAKLRVACERKITPFIHLFLIKKHGITS